MEREFSVSKRPSGSLLADVKGFTCKFIAVCISVLLLTQIAMVGFCSFGVQYADAATLPSGLVYKYAYGVRSDGIACFRNNDYDGVIVNSSGKIVFKEVYKNKTETYTNPDGTKHSYTYKAPVLQISGSAMQANYLGGNLMVCKSVYSPHEESYTYTGIDGRPETYTYTVDYRHYYGLIDPHTGKYILQPNTTYDKVIAYCKKRGWKTDEKYQTEKLKWKLPNGTIVQLKHKGKKGYQYVKSNGSAATVAGYQLGNTSAFINDNNNSNSKNSVIFRKGVAGGNLYYVHNSKGKIGAVNDKGKVLIPFEYDAYYDAGAGSQNILLKKGKSWKYFDLKSIKSPTSSQSGKWISNSKGKSYRYSNGSYATGKKKIGSYTYYFDKNGRMKTGWQTISGKRYYFNTSTGAATKGWKTISGKRYYFDASTYAAAKGFKKIGGKRYYFDPSTGAATKGWKTISGKRYYFNTSNYAAFSGFKNIGGKRYYFDPSTNAAIKGWKTISNKRYYFKSDYAATKGWQTISGKRYYFDSSGVWQKGK